MAKLILSMDGLVLKEIPLNKERTTLGRKPHNDIQIDNLAISGEHAVIVTILNDSFLEDLNSTNGTYVNGQPIKKHFLQNTDVVELGKYRLKYVNEQASSGTPADFEKTMVLRPEMMRKPQEAAAAKSPTDTHAGLHPDTATRPPEPVRPAPAPPQAAPRPVSTPAPATAAPIAPPPDPAPRAPAAALGVIQLLNGANAGKELELTKTLTTLGKPGVQVAVITRRPQGYFITHVEGSTLPIVNGKTLDVQAHPLREHDVIELAGVKMEFFLKA